MSRLGEFHQLRSLVTDDCVVWPHSSNGRYGRISYRGRVYYAHRLALILATEIDPPEMHAAHGPCHTSTCINVAHLSWATGSQNQADRVRDGTDNRGERHGNARLTESDARAILASTETAAALAHRFKISEGQIHNIRNGWSWAHLQPNDSPKQRRR